MVAIVSPVTSSYYLVLSWLSILSNVMVWLFRSQCQFSPFLILLFATHFFLSCPSYKISFFSSLYVGLSSFRQKLSWLVFFLLKLVFGDWVENKQYALDTLLIPQYTHRYTAAAKYLITVSATEKRTWLGTALPRTIAMTWKR